MTRADRMAAMFVKGAEPRDIAECFGVNPPAVWKALRRVGVLPEYERRKATARAPQPPSGERRRLLDHFAECLANGNSVGDSAGLLGKSFGWGEQALRDIRKGLGWQAR